MKEIKITTSYTKYEQLTDLPEAVFSLMQHAIEARNKAYAPYSNFNVGAALLLDNGEIITGNNQENAAYPSGLCAERVAFFYAGAHHSTAKIKQVAISATSVLKPVEEPIPPCGACRQSMAEYEIKQEAPIAVYFMGEKGAVLKSDSISDLLPLLFQKSHL